MTVPLPTNFSLQGGTAGPSQADTYGEYIYDGSFVVGSGAGTAGGAGQYIGLAVLAIAAWVLLKVMRR